MNLLPAEAALRLRVSKGTMANWRMNGAGPAYIRVSGRKILYSEEALASFEQSHLKTSTAAPIEERAGGR